MSFYAYIHCKPDGTPFYVGKGDEKRVSFKKRNHNPRHMNILNKYGETNILVGKMECSTEDNAFNLERGLIKRLRKMGVSIVNLTDGGDGAAGAVRSPETKAKMSSAQVGNKNSVGSKRTPETRAKMALAKVGNQWNVGRKCSLETKIKKSRSLGGSAVECRKGDIVLRFPTITEACKELGLNLPNVVHHLRRKSDLKSSGVKGWYFYRIDDVGSLRKR
jgi:group I intron endonuclease